MTAIVGDTVFMDQFQSRDVRILMSLIWYHFKHLRNLKFLLKSLFWVFMTINDMRIAALLEPAGFPGAQRERELHESLAVIS